MLDLAPKFGLKAEIVGHEGDEISLTPSKSLHYSATSMKVLEGYIALRVSRPEGVKQKPFNDAVIQAFADRKAK